VIRALATYARSFTGFGRDARLFLLTTIVFGAATSLYWIDFNLYLDALGVDRSTIGWLMATSQLAGVAVALPTSALSDRIGRRTVMAIGMTLAAVALLTFLPGQLLLLFAGVVALGAGSQMVWVVQVPYIAEHTRDDQRNHYYAVWAGITNLTMLVSALVGAAVAQLVADHLALTSAAGPYQVLFVGVAILGIAGLGTVALLSNDREAVAAARAERSQAASGASLFGLHIVDRRLFFRLLLPGFITSLGAGQLIPFLNLFVQTKFGLDLFSINLIFGITSLGTTVAMLAQPALAARFGRIGSIVLVQGTSIPFLVVLGFSPVLGTVILAMAVRNSLMNAGNPIFDAFAMERVTPAERATLSALMTMLWSVGWVIAPIYYSTLQATLGFTGGYAVNFVTIIVLYTISTSLLWTWFHGADRAREAAPEGTAAEAEAEALAAEGVVAATLERA
jgi:MFS family permease